MYSGYPFPPAANPHPYSSHPPHLYAGAHPMSSPSSYYHFPEPAMYTADRDHSGRPSTAGPPPVPWPGIGSLYSFPFPYPYPYSYPSDVDIGAYAYRPHNEHHNGHPIKSNNDKDGGNSNKANAARRSSREGSSDTGNEKRGTSASFSSSSHHRDRGVVGTEGDVQESLNEAGAPECGEEVKTEGLSAPKQAKAKAHGASDNAERKPGGPPMYHQRFPFPFQPYYAMPFPGPVGAHPPPLSPGASYPFPCPPPPPPPPFSMFDPHAQGKDGPHPIPPPFVLPPFLSASPPPLPNYHPLHVMNSIPKDHPYHAQLNEAVQSLNKMGAVGESFLMLMGLESAKSWPTRKEEDK